MIKLTTREDCCGCFACASSCPVNCIEMKPDPEGFLYLDIDVARCTNCGTCDRVCPMHRAVADTAVPTAYAAWAKDESVRLQSSSGGVFTILARKLIADGGVVFGAAFDASMHLVHSAAETEADLTKFQGSKYLQSAIGNSYLEARAFLKQGRKVLFSGTPCQIAGLYQFLKQPYENLITVDVVCHGVPSPTVFASYKRLREQEKDSVASHIEFRNKHQGWKQFMMRFSFANGKHYTKNLREDPFMRGFLDNLYLRPCCHACEFSRIPRVADLSLGDFWGVNQLLPDWDDDKGTSLVLAQTQKGKDFFLGCSDFLIVHPTDLTAAIAHNPAVDSASTPHPKREAFFTDFNSKPYAKVEKAYMCPSISSRLRAQKRDIFILLSLIWMALIFYFSAQNATLSSANSTSLVVSGIEFISRLSGTVMPEPEKLLLATQLQDLVRTLGHFMEYLILGLLVFHAFLIQKKGLLKTLATILVICVAYALTDEIHQLFVPGRAFQLEDLFVDACGSALGIAMAVGVVFLRRKFSKKARKSGKSN